MIRTFRTAYFKNEDDPFRHLSNWVSVNGTLGAYVCWPTTFMDGANECRNVYSVFLLFERKLDWWYL